MEALSCAESAFVVWVWVHQGNVFPCSPPLPSLGDKHGGWGPIPQEWKTWTVFLAHTRECQARLVVEGLESEVRQVSLSLFDLGKSLGFGGCVQ